MVEKIIFTVMFDIILVVMLWWLGNKETGPLVAYGVTSVSYSIFMLYNNAIVVTIAAICGVLIAAAAIAALTK